MGKVNPYSVNSACKGACDLSVHCLLSFEKAYERQYCHSTSIRLH